MKSYCQQFAGAVALVLLTSGCATQSLWGDNGVQRVTCGPAAAPRLALFEAEDRNEVLVLYDALRTRNLKVERRAYFLCENQPRVKAGEKPVFVAPELAQGLPGIPLFTNVPSAAEGGSPFAVIRRGGKEFTLHHPQSPPEDFVLPIFPDPSPLAERVLLTPVAVAADGAILGAGLIWYGVSWPDTTAH